MANRVGQFFIWMMLLLAMRGVGLAAYPQIHPDEGFWTQGARNWVLHGDPIRDGRLHPFLCPGHFVQLAGFFQIADPSLLGGRWFSVFLGLGTCLLLADLGRKIFPRHPWLFMVLFGCSSLSFLIHRLALLEANQMFWMTLAGWFWLSSYRLGPLGVGLAFGMALLVKSNSIYLLPAFVLGVPSREKQPSWLALGWLLCGTLLLAGGGYWLDWWISPENFARAFGFELHGQDFEQENYLFRVGRFGINPAQMWLVFKSLILGEPFLVLLSLWGLLLLLKKPWQASQPDRFFASWLILGLCFHFPQIFVEHRYLTTLAPAFAYWSARLLHHFLEEGKAPWQRLLPWGVLGLFLAFHLLKVERGITQDVNRTYWQTVDYIRQEIPADANVLAASYLVQSVPQNGYDFYRVMFPYDRSQPHKPLGEVVAHLKISVIVIDSEWHKYLDQDIQTYLEENCVIVKSIEDFRIYKVRPLAERAERVHPRRRNEIRISAHGKGYCHGPDLSRRDWPGC
jgi:hypothetical protein